jgi:zinc/manganese transport system substrate-binding protein
MVKQIGGDRVEVTSFVGPNGDAHVYEPTPGDAKTLADAPIPVVNGLGLEGWMSRLPKSSGFKGTVATATKGIKSRQMEEDAHNKTRKITDPHAWQSLASGKI